VCGADPGHAWFCISAFRRMALSGEATALMWSLSVVSTVPFDPHRSVREVRSTPALSFDPVEFPVIDRPRNPSVPATLIWFDPDIFLRLFR